MDAGPSFFLFFGSDGEGFEGSDLLEGIGPDGVSQSTRSAGSLPSAIERSSWEVLQYLQTVECREFLCRGFRPLGIVIEGSP